MALTPERAELRHRLAELETELTAARFTGRPAESGVSVVVDGKGRLIEVRIEDAALRGAHPERIGPDIVTALATARAKASAAAAARMAELTESETAGRGR
jgi:DNA-binding protein YbaB